MNPTCSFSGCEKSEFNRKHGLCSSHYHQHKIGKQLAPLRPHGKRSGICQSEFCTMTASASGMCKAHYEIDRDRRYGRSCSFQACEKPVSNVSFLLCAGHNQQRIKGKNLTALRMRRRPEGYRWHDDDGYVYIAARNDPRSNVNGYIFEHRLVMSDFLGRPLLPMENVHHKNGVKDDNQIANLELWTRSQPSGQRVVDKVAWAKEILATYGEDFSSGVLVG